jgi:hypothetical protein
MVEGERVGGDEVYGCGRGINLTEDDDNLNTTDAARGRLAEPDSDQ